MTRPKILKPSDFSSFISQPLSLNGSLEWQCEWLVDKIVLQGGFNIIGGAPKVGKSLLRSHLLVSVMVGRPAFGSLTTKKAERGLLLAGEESLEVEEARLRRAARALDLKDMTLPIHVMPQYGFFLDDRDSFGNFVDWVVDEGFDFVVIDPLIRWHRANENASGELSPVLSDLRRLCHLGVTVVVVHHTGKPKEGDEDWPLGYLLRGTSDLAAIYDQLVVMKKVRGRSKVQRRVLVDTRPDESADPFDVDLVFGEQKSFTFRVRQPTKDAILEAVQISGPISANRLTKKLRRDKTKILQELQVLKTQGLIEQGEDGWSSNFPRES